MQALLSLLCSKLFFLAIFLHGRPTSAFNQSLRIGGDVSDPCEQARPAVEKANSFAATTIFFTSLKNLKNSAAADPFHEHTVAFGKDEQANAIASSISTGSKSNSVVPHVQNAFADLHTHPRHTPPSSGDLYGLLRQHRKDSGYNMRFVLLPGVALYALVITDAAAAGSFYEKFPPQQTPGYSPLFPDTLLNEYREIIHRYNAREEMAMAYMLEKYRAGVSLLKQESGGAFTVLRTAAHEVNGQLVFVAGNCH